MRVVRSFAFAILLPLVLSVVSDARPQQPVDAATFALAFRVGKADQYKGQTIAGTGVMFGVSAPQALLAVGSSADGKQVTPLATDGEFRAAQMAHTTLMVMVDSPDYSPQDRAREARQPAIYTFTGVYNGRMRTAMRPASPNGAPDSGKCPPQPDDPPNLRGMSTGAMTEYCVPMLDSGTLTKQ